MLLSPAGLEDRLLALGRESAGFEPSAGRVGISSEERLASAREGFHTEGRVSDVLRPCDRDLRVLPGVALRESADGSVALSGSMFSRMKEPNW